MSYTKGCFVPEQVKNLDIFLLSKIEKQLNNLYLRYAVNQPSTYQGLFKRQVPSNWCGYKKTPYIQTFNTICPAGQADFRWSPISLYKTGNLKINNLKEDKYFTTLNKKCPLYRDINNNNNILLTYTRGIFKIDKQKRKDRIIKDYYDHIFHSKQEKPFYELIIQVGNKDDTPCNSDEGKLASQILIEFEKDFQKRNPHCGSFPTGKINIKRLWLLFL